MILNNLTQREEEMDRLQLERAAALTAARYDHPPLAFVHSFGCQQNVSDGEHLKGLLAEMGFGFTDSAENADLILFNTCAVRESAEDRVFGNVGALKNIKRERPELMIALCGCMMQRPEVAERIKKSFPYVDIVFGTGAMHRLPEFLIRRLEGGRRVFWDQPAKNVIEGIPAVREEGVKAWLPIMQGCNNFCTYCIVPYVRGREVSRTPERIEKEARELVGRGYREITLLGQNVNSYGRGLAKPCNFPELLRRLDRIEGEYRLRFMTSHPKDCTRELIDVIAQSRHVCRHIHLPVQSGSDRVVQAMNGHYHIGGYLELIAYAREKMPDVTFSSDIIVGFPGETREEFLETLALIKRVRYNALFTFIYSRRAGTPAAEMPDPVPAGEKSEWFRELLEVQQGICCELNEAMVGSIQRVLFDSPGKSAEGFLAGRTEGNVIVEAPGDRSLIGRFLPVKITRAMTWAMVGTILESR